jgi:hypothetical protein
MGLPVTPLFDLGVDFHVFKCKTMGFKGYSSRFEVTVLVKSVNMFHPNPIVCAFSQCYLIADLVIFQ